MQDASKRCPIGDALEGHDGAAQVLGLVRLVFSFEDDSHISPTQVAGVGNGSGVVDNLIYFPLIQQGGTAAAWRLMRCRDLKKPILDFGSVTTR
jgi:hypothetical protein